MHFSPLQILLPVLISLGVALAEPDVTGYFHLVNGDVVAGNRAVVDGEILRMSAPTLDAVVEFEASDLLAWSVARVSPASAEKLSRVQFHNGDQVDVKIVEMDDEWLHVETAWGDANALRVADIARVILPGEEVPIYRGPQPLSDFLTGNSPAGPESGWVEADGGIFSRSERKSGLDLPLQETGARFQITLEFKSQGDPGLALDLFGTGRREKGPNWIYLRQRGDQISVNARGSEVSGLNAGAIQSPESRDGAYRVDLYANLVDNHYAVRWNGILVREWRDRGGNGADSFVFNRLRLQFTGSEPVMIQELTLKPWDGRLPPDRVDQKAGVGVIFRNLDGRTWKSVRIQEGNLEMTPPEGPPLSVPLDRVVEWKFPLPSPQLRPSEPPKVELHFALPGNRLTVPRAELRAGIVHTGHAAFREPLLLPLGALQGIHWLNRSQAEAEVHAETPYLRMLSGEKITGHPLGFTGGRLHFQPVWNESALSVPLRNVGRLHQLGRADVEEAPHRFLLQNLNRVRGTLREVGETNLTFLSAWGEVLSVDRRALREVSQPGGTQGGWVHEWGDGSDWQVTDRRGQTLDPKNVQEGAIARGGVTYARRLPGDANRIMMDIPIEANASLGLLFNLFSSGPTRGNQRDGVEVNIPGRQILARAQGKAEWINFERIPGEPNRLQVFFDPEADTIHVFLNEEKVGTLNVPLPVDVGTRWMWFQSISRDFSTEGFQVLPWSGEPDPTRKKEAPPEGDELRLADRRRLRGKLLPSAEGQIRFKPEDDTEPIDVPIQEMLRLQLATAAPLLPRRNARDVQVILRGESQPLTLALIEGDAHRITLTGDAWPSEVSVPMSHIDTLIFNPYQNQRQDQNPPRPRGRSFSRP